jgi:macrodomain Ter protein organizer (MatP/YcbG family)
MMQNDVTCIKIHQMTKRTTITLEQETYEKLVKLAERKKWSLTKTVEFILLKYIKERSAKPENNS